MRKEKNVDDEIKERKKAYKQPPPFKNLSSQSNVFFGWQVHFLVGFVEERLPWPIQSPNRGRKKKANS